MLSNMTNNNHNSIEPKVLISLHRLGFKLVPLSENHKPVIEWSSIYNNSEYWNIQKFNDPKEYSKFKNVVSTVGKSHLRDSENNDLFIQVLDVDSEPVYNKLNTTIDQLNINSTLKSKIIVFLVDDLKISENQFLNLTLLDVFKKHTFVTKTKKSFGRLRENCNGSGEFRNQSAARLKHYKFPLGYIVGTPRLIYPP